MGGFVAAAGDFEPEAAPLLHVVEPPTDEVTPEAAIIELDVVRVTEPTIESTIYAW